MLTSLQRTILNTFVVGLLASLGFASDVKAHNNVVVIPMAGDDVVVEVPAELTPSSPVSNVDTNQNDYTIGALTVIDDITKLEWQRQDDDLSRSWNDAWDYCVSLELDGHSDWRLPALTELQSIVDYGSSTSPLIDQVAFPNTDSVYWSASIQARSSSRAWGVIFSAGFIDASGATTMRFVRCVR